MRKQREHLLFAVGMWWRILYGVFRISLGLLLLKIIHQPISELLRTLWRNDLVDDPRSSLAFYLFNFFAHHDFTVTFFFAFYFIFWGVVDILLSVALLHHQMWAFPFSVMLIISFMVYELVRLLETHSPVLIVLLCIDTLVLWLIYREWSRLVKKGTAELGVEKVPIN